MRRLQAECAQEPVDVAGHVEQGVRRGSGGGTTAQQRTQVGDAGLGEVGGQPDVPVVEADDVEAVAREPGTEPFVPAQHLGRQAHHEQEGRVGRVAEALVGDLDVGDGRLLHLLGLGVGHGVAPRVGGPASLSRDGSE